MATKDNDNKETIIQTLIGEFRLYENGCFGIHPKDTDKACNIARFAQIFEENGYKGLKKDGKVIVPPFFDEIAILQHPDRLFLLREGRYARFAKDSTSYMEAGYNENNRFIFKDGKMGWFRNGKIVVEPLYDEVERWGCFNIYETRNRNTVKYFTEDGNEVLTFKREVDEGDDLVSPFWVRCDEGDVLCMLECPPSDDLPQSNILTFNNDILTGLDRFNRNSILKELINKKDELYLTNRKLEGLTNEFSYEFSAYRLKVDGDKPIEKLLDLFNRLYINDNSWFYVIRLTTYPGEKIPAAQLLKLSEFLDANKRDTLGRSIGLGVDVSLKPGEVGALVITHYNECCFPPSEHFEWIDVCKNGTLGEVKEAEKNLLEFVENNVDEEYQEDFLKDNYESAIGNIGYAYQVKRRWEETEKVLDYLATKTRVFEKRIWRYVKKICSNDQFEDMDFLVKYLEWILANGADANVVKNHQTPLDYVYQIMKDEGKGTDKNMIKVRNALIRNNGTTYEKYREEFLKDHSEYEFALKVLSQES